MTPPDGSTPRPLPVPGLELITRIEVTADDVVDVGHTDVGHRRIAHLTGGTVRGPRLSGIVLPGGADWQVVLADGTVTIDTRYTVRADDGAVVHVRASGLRTGPRHVLDALADGQDVDPDSYYFRSVAWFETGAERHRWLARTMTVCSVARLPGSVLIDAYTLT